MHRSSVPKPPRISSLGFLQRHAVECWPRGGAGPTWRSRRSRPWDARQRRRRFCEGDTAALAGVPSLRACRSSEKKDGQQASSSFGASWAWSAGWLLAPARPRPVPHSSSSGHISSSCLAAPRSCPPRHEAWQASARPAYTACTVLAARPAARTPRRAAPHAHAQHDVMCMYFMGLIYTTAPHQGRLSRGTSVPSYSVLD